MTTILAHADGDVILVDVTSDNLVTMTTSTNREEGTPESALKFAERLRTETPLLEEVALALEEAARIAMDRRRRIAPQPS